MHRESDYEWLTKMNLCHKCRHERPAPGRKFCFDCLDKIREENAKRYDSEKAHNYQIRRRELYYQSKERGICVRCSKPATHGLYCYECSIRVKRHNHEVAERRKRERRERGLIPEIRKKEGKCIRCGCDLLNHEKNYCDVCLKQMKASLDLGRKKSPFRQMEQMRYQVMRNRKGENR